MAIAFQKTHDVLAKYRKLHYAPEIVLDLWLTQHGDVGLCLAKEDLIDGPDNLFGGDAVMRDVATIAALYTTYHIDTAERRFETAAHMLHLRHDFETDTFMILVRLKKEVAFVKDPHRSAA
jgi:hypothetical protein